MSAVPSPRATSGQGLTLRLAERAAGLRHADLPADVRLLIRQCLLDWVAVTLAGATEPLTRMLVGEVREEGGRPQATIIGHGFAASMLQAALVNGSASHALDYDDVNIAFTGHPSVAVIPALLALAEARGADGRAFMAAFAAGYETICRVGLLVAPGHYGRGFHSTATVGTFGAAAACAHLLGADAATLATAMGIAGTQAAGMKSLFGTMCKPLHAGKACYNGLLAARLALRGFTARPDVLECPQGFAATHSDDFHPDTALAEPRGGFHLHDNLFKYHAACYGTHAAIEAARRLRHEHQLTPERIRRVIVRVDPASDKVCNIGDPRTGLESKFSLRHTVAFALAGIDTASLETYSDDNAVAAALVALRDKIQIDLAVGQGHTITDSEVVAETIEGARYVLRYDSGIPASDLHEQQRQLEAKFTSLATPALGREGAAEVLAVIAGTDDLSSMTELTRLLA